MSTVGTSGSVGAGRLPVAALACGVVAIVAAAIAFWLIVPAVVLGLAAVFLGLRGRKRAGVDPRGRELAAAGIALGVAAILLLPAMHAVSKGGESFGRGCAINPTNPYC